MKPAATTSRATKRRIGLLRVTRRRSLPSARSSRVVGAAVTARLRAMATPDDSAPLAAVLSVLDDAQRVGVGDMDPETFRAAGHDVVDRMADYLAGVERYPVLPRVTPGELAAQMKMDASTLTRNLRPLVDAGWVSLQAGSDARSRLVHITEAGRAKRAEGQRCWKVAQQSLNNTLGAERVNALHALVDDSLALLAPTQEPCDDE